MLWCLKCMVWWCVVWGFIFVSFSMLWVFINVVLKVLCLMCCMFNLCSW